MEEEKIMKYIIENFLTKRELDIFQKRIDWITYNEIAKDYWITMARVRQVYEKTAERVKDTFEKLKNKDLNTDYLKETIKIKHNLWIRW